MLSSLAHVVCLTALQTPSGRLTVRGSGPPVLFTSGLYNIMPRWAYSSFLRQLESEDLTVVRLERSGVVEAVDVANVADALGVSELGLITHSSLSPSLLESDRIRRFALLDPVSLPDGVDLATQRLRSTIKSVQRPALVLRAEYAFSSQVPFIPPGFELGILDAETHVFDGMGHSDVLDDMWADLADRMGIRGHRRSVPLLDYSVWSGVPKKAAVSDGRRAYRNALASTIGEFMRRDVGGALTTIN